LVVELDGPIHLKRKKEDQLRDAIINDLGIQVIRFKNEMVETKTDYVIERINKYL
jgi:very-short-patch-repair endonuclease